MSGLLALATALFLLVASGCFGGSGGTADDDESTTSTTEPRVLVVTTTTTTPPSLPTATTPETTTTNRPLGGPRMHIVSAGEVLGQIAEQYGVSVEAIVEANALDNPDRIDVDQKLVIPPPENNG